MATLRAVLRDRRVLLNAALATIVGAAVGAVLALISHDGFFVGLGACMSLGSSIGYSMKETAAAERRQAE